jgi:lauroyl/myristoyl acyltransferase
LLGIDQRVGRFNHKTVVSGPIEIEACGDIDKDIVALTQKATFLLEGHIAKFPEQGVWFHKRWNTQK